MWATAAARLAPSNSSHHGLDADDDSDGDVQARTRRLVDEDVVAFVAGQEGWESARGRVGARRQRQTWWDAGSVKWSVAEAAGERTGTERTTETVVPAAGTRCTAALVPKVARQQQQAEGEGAGAPRREGKNPNPRGGGNQAVSVRQAVAGAGVLGRNPNEKKRARTTRRRGRKKERRSCWCWCSMALQAPEPVRRSLPRPWFPAADEAAQTGCGARRGGNAATTPYCKRHNKRLEREGKPQESRWL